MSNAMSVGLVSFLVHSFRTMAMAAMILINSTAPHNILCQTQMLHNNSFGCDQIKKVEVGGASIVHRRVINVNNFVSSLKGRDDSKDLGVVGRMVVKHVIMNEI